MTQPGMPVGSLLNLSNSIVNGGTFIQHTHIHSREQPTGYARLLENVATSALHDSVDDVDPPKCHPNTRVAIIQNIIDWTFGTDEKLRGKPILWLKGGAGVGKSAIARSVAERCLDEGLLLGAFFFKAGDTSRNHVGNLVATISYQISTCLPKFRDAVSAIIEDSPLIFKSSIKTQFSTLIIRPLSVVLANCSTTSIPTPRLIIIDGLDECSAVNSQRDLVLTLQDVTNTTALIRFLVCSRPESHLNAAFSLPRMVPTLHIIFLDNDYVSSKDIRVYLQDRFKQIKEGHVFKHKLLADPWPTPKMLDTLVRKSSGQFIYAATVIRYLESPRHRPDQRLNAIFKLRPPFKDLPFTELDALYQQIISKAEDPPTVLDVLAFPALYGFFSLEDMEAILQLEEGSADVILADLHSILSISNRYVQFLHKSFADFLSEPQRAGDLYRNLFKARLSHVARLISLMSTHHGLQTGYVCCSWMIHAPIQHVLRELGSSDNINADYVSPGILQASQQFPIVDFFKPLLSDSYRERNSRVSSLNSDQEFFKCYLHYLYCVKDVCESTRVVYWEQMHEYCKCVLAALDNNWTDNWNAHFIFAYHHLLHDPRYPIPRNLLYAKLYQVLSDIDGLGGFGGTILRVIAPLRQNAQHFDDMAKISHHLRIGDIEKEAIFAKSACFCLALLCDEGSTSLDTSRINGIARHNRWKMREFPWLSRRQMVPIRGPSPLRDRLALISFRNISNGVYISKLTRIRKALQSSIPYRYDNIQIITMREHFQLKADESVQVWSVGKQSASSLPQQWPLYKFLLDMLPRILPLTGRYEPLVDMCRKRCLSSLSQFWPKKSRRVRQAIDCYLRRVDEQGDVYEVK
ncbi:hypothetical protein CPC08DRAFT_709347 [Agrocybe pediades]|nr:hypothetical protein CPC08DRAFT_709347 [Agrocybe pediades]